MLHTYDPPLSVEELKEVMTKASANTALNTDAQTTRAG
jgi:hypothetical protein